MLETVRTSQNRTQTCDLLVRPDFMYQTNMRKSLVHGFGIGSSAPVAGTALGWVGLAGEPTIPKNIAGIRTINVSRMAYIFDLIFYSWSFSFCFHVMLLSRLFCHVLIPSKSTCRCFVPLRRKRFFAGPHWLCHGNPCPVQLRPSQRRTHDRDQCGGCREKGLSIVSATYSPVET